MIRILLGNPGSGKTACMVREMKLNKAKRHYFSNIKTSQIPGNTTIAKDMIVTIEQQGKKEIYSLNKDFWKQVTEQYKGISVILDEAHTIMNPRRSMSKHNQIIVQFLAMIRRVLGGTESGHGELILITQLGRGLEIYAREMSSKVQYHVCHYKKKCIDCRKEWWEHNEFPEPVFQCSCGSTRIQKYHHLIEVWHFQNMDYFTAWKETKTKTYHRHYLVQDIEQYFPFYNTLQWENLIMDY